MPLAMRLLAEGRALRGTALDLHGYTEDRRMEMMHGVLHCTQGLSSVAPVPWKSATLRVTTVMP